MFIYLLVVSRAGTPNDIQIEGIVLDFPAGEEVVIGENVTVQEDHNTVQDDSQQRPVSDLEVPQNSDSQEIPVFDLNTENTTALTKNFGGRSIS